VLNKVSDFMSNCWKYSTAVTPSHLKPCELVGNAEERKQAETDWTAGVLEALYGISCLHTALR